MLLDEGAILKDIEAKQGNGWDDVRARVRHISPRNPGGKKEKKLRAGELLGSYSAA
jgi:hypothetical protein